MTRALRVFPDYPWTGTPLEQLKMWRREMGVRLFRGQGNLMGLMFARNRVRTWRDELASEEWSPCPSCGGRGLWVDQGCGNRYCARCSGTGILLTCEQEVLQPRVPIREGALSRLRKRLHLAPRKNVVFGRRP